MKRSLIGVMLATLTLTGCQSSQRAHPAALTGDSESSANPSNAKATRVVSVRDTRGHVRHRVVSDDR